MEKYENLKNYLLSNEEELKSIISDINCYNGNLPWLECYDNDEYTINELFSSPAEALRSAYFGDYDYNKPYFKFNGYGNIESLDEYDLRNQARNCIDDIINELLDCWGMLPELSEELTQLLVDLNKEDNEQG